MGNRKPGAAVCPSSYDLKQIVPIRILAHWWTEVMRPAADAASGGWRSSGV
jgi:hypothetical protein